MGESNATILGHALFGAAHNRESISGGVNPTGSAPSFSWAGGAGVDHRIANHFAVRGATDVRYTHFSAGDNQLQPQVADWHARLSVDVVITF
jgi:opacity protein-like surface antigen